MESNKKYSDTELDKKISNCKLSIKKYEDQLDKAKKYSRKKELREQIHILKERIKKYNIEKRKLSTIERNSHKKISLRQQKLKAEEKYNKDSEKNKQIYQKQSTQYNQKAENFEKQFSELDKQIESEKNPIKKLKLQLKRKQLEKQELQFYINWNKSELQYALITNNKEKINQIKEDIKDNVDSIKQIDKEIRTVKSELTDISINQLSNYQKQNSKFSKKFERIFSPKKKNEYKTKIQQLKKNANLSESVFLDLYLDTLCESHNF